MDEAFRQTYAPGVMEAVPELGWEQAKIDGQPYMVPYNLQEFGQEVMAIRGDLMDQFGIESVSNWDEYVAFNLRYAANAKRKILQGRAIYSESFRTSDP
jgi:putative aldouronate transport system substrate-binding protein